MSSTVSPHIIALEVASGDARPIFRQIVDGLRMEMASGGLPTGALLPSVRGLAQQLGINANTVAKAYNELVAQGLLESRRGVGVFVAEPRQILSDAERERRLNEAVLRLVADTAYLDFAPEDILERISAALDAIKKEHS